MVASARDGLGGREKRQNSTVHKDCVDQPDTCIVGEHRDTSLIMGQTWFL